MPIALGTARSSAIASAPAAASPSAGKYIRAAAPPRRPHFTPHAAAAPTRRASPAPMSHPRSMDSHVKNEGRIVAAAAERNKDAILEVLKRYLDGAEGLVLEVASGTGQHTAHFAAALPALTFQPTEYNPDAAMLQSIAAWSSGLPNVRAPRALDAAQPDGWGVEAGSCRAVYAANVTHISPWAVTLGLLRGAGRVLAPGGQLFLYGPFSVDGKPTTESNAAFDQSLRARNPEWGYRDVADVAAAAAAAGLQLQQRHDMPANNFMLVFRAARQP